MPKVNVADAVETLEIVVADLPTTPELIRATYQALYAAQTTVFDAVRQHTDAVTAAEEELVLAKLRLSELLLLLWLAEYIQSGTMSQDSRRRWVSKPKVLPSLCPTVWFIRGD